MYGLVLSRSFHRRFRHLRHDGDRNLKIVNNEMNQTPNLKEEFPEQYDKLVLLFGNEKVQSKLDRLNIIYASCEKAWKRNLDRLSNTEVKYLLIGEAPPWSLGDVPRYFYETFDKGDKDDNGNRKRPIQWIRGLWKVFYPTPPPSDNDESLRMLAESQFLLVDSLPFAFNYESSDRDTTEYKELVRSCREYLMMKLNCNGINWSNDCKIALAFKRNGLAVIGSFPEGITLPNGQNVVSGKANIAATGSGFLTTTSLRRIWGIEDHCA
jgi:hypothetical protein